LKARSSNNDVYEGGMPMSEIVQLGVYYDSRMYILSCMASPRVALVLLGPPSIA
jgi:hypothetical protein